MGRASNYELARVIAMVLIVYFHFSINTNWPIEEHPKDDEGNEIPYVLPMNHFTVLIFKGLGKTGVQLFVIMSGYFLGTKTASISSVLRTWFRVISWCWIIPFGCHFFQDKRLDYDDWMKALFPVLTCSYWFVTVYLFTMFLSPMLSKVVQNVSVIEYAGILGTLFFAQCLSIYWKYTHRLHDFCYSPLLWFIFLYLVGAFIRVYPERLPQWRARTYSATLAALFMLDLATLYYFHTHQEMQWIQDNGGKWGGSLTLLWPDNSILSFFFALNIFLLCGQLSFESNTVNWLAKMTFSVYLIHDHYMIRWYIFERWIGAHRWYDSPKFYPVFIIAPALIFMVCTCLEALRQKIFAKVETHVCNALASVLQDCGVFAIRILRLEEYDKEEALLPLTSGEV